MQKYKSNEKMDIGDIGFLIVAFIVFIINFIVKGNKNKEQGEKPVIPQMPEPWEVRETLPPFSQKNAEVTKKRTLRPILSSQESNEQVKNHFQVSQEGMSSLSESLYKEDEMESITYQDEGESEISFTNELFHGNITEELKKGIIYSEILHRKYE
ncbi:MAG: hypothetical protein PHN55_03945 [Dysgonamonadaceae bacterium]|nr:hypothetical protein [Dysgonamonadaceae bacterium]